MAWTAKFKSAELKEGVWSIRIRFTDGTEAFSRTFRSETASDEYIKVLTRGEIRRLDRASAAAVKLLDGDTIDITEPAPEPVPDLTPEQRWTKRHLELQLRIKLRDEGIAVAGNDAEIATLQAWLTEKYKGSFVGLN